MFNNLSTFIIDTHFQDYLSQIGSPAYVYNLDILEYTLNEISKYFKREGIKIYYALKANQNLEILKKIRNNIDGVDVASIEEYRKVKYMFKGKDISITGPGLKFDEIKEIYKDNNIIDFNTLSQLTNCSSFLYNKEIGLRINMDYTYENQTMKSRFGISSTDSIKNTIDDLKVSLVRIHIHNGKKNNLFFIYFKNLLDNLNAHNLLINIREINLGGGINGLFNEQKTEWFFEELQKIKHYYFKNQQITFILEPGRGIVENCGFLISKVLTADIDKDTNMLNVVTDTSCYNLFPWFKPKVLSHTSDDCTEINTNIYGMTCYEGDIFIENKKMRTLRIGDRLLFYPVGAYSKSNHSNLHYIPFPKEYYYTNKES